MRSRNAFVVAALLFALGAPAWAYQQVTAEDYDAAMKSVRTTMEGVESHLEAQDATALGEDGAAFVEAFSKVDGFWKAREEQEAMELAARALTAAQRFQEAGAAGDFDLAERAFGAMRETCMSCHRQYRERDADGNWQIRGGGW